MKKCSTCKIEKDFIEFSKNKTRKDGFQNTCIYCNKIYINNNKEKIKENKSIYYNKNRESFLLKKKEYGLNNKEKIKEKQKEYCKKNREKINNYYRVYTKNRKENDKLFKLSCNLRTLIGMSIKGKGYTKKSKTNEILGCSFKEFKQHLELQFTEGMTWNNAGKWHLDHIYPVSLSKDENELIKLNHYTNFQPLWAEDNIRKGNKII
jgi:hypothetical protein